MKYRCRRANKQKIIISQYVSAQTVILSSESLHSPLQSSKIVGKSAMTRTLAGARPYPAHVPSAHTRLTIRQTGQYWVHVTAHVPWAPPLRPVTAVTGEAWRWGRVETSRLTRVAGDSLHQPHCWNDHSWKRRRDVSTVDWQVTARGQRPS